MASTLDPSYPLSSVSSPSDASSDFNVKDVLNSVRKSATPDMYNAVRRSTFSSFGGDVSSAGNFDDDNDRSLTIKG